MDVILLEKVENLGKVGDLVKVRSGYGRNFLLPRGKATLATPSNVAIFEARRADLEQKEADDLRVATERAASAGKLVLKLAAKAGTEGKLFGSLGTADIAEACTAAGVTVRRSEVRLPYGPIRTLGEHEIELHLHTDVNATIRVTVVAEEDGSKAG
ncbi:MAG: 50S ribosomal protein L9 [Gammaproteobacteria bacterium]